MRWNILGFGLLALACGNESVESEDIRTTGIYPEIEVTASGNGRSTVRVRLLVGGDDSNTLLNLKGEDTLTATVEDDTKTLDDTGNFTYSASFDVDAEGTEFSIAFTRGDADESAPASVVSLPAPFELSLAATSSSRADDDVEISWEPSASGEMDWEIDGDCIIGDDGSVPDDGSHSLPAGSIDTFESDAMESCTVDLSLTRSQPGTIDSAFTEGGRIVARQVRGDSFTSTP